MGAHRRSSIIVVTHNHREHIQRCLFALSSTVGSGDEVIVVDNQSTDGTPEYVATEFPTLRLISNRQNRGFGAACNQAVRQGVSEFVVFLNPDTEARAGWLDALLVPLEPLATTVGLTTPKILLLARPTRIDTFGHNVHISGLATCRGWGEPSQAHDTVEDVAAVSGACFAIRRELFTRLGGFDERLFLYYEDDDLSLRARLLGWKCVAVPNSQVLHDHTPGFSPEKLRYLERNRLWCTLKLYHWSTLLALLPVILGAEILGWGTAILNGPRHVLAKLHACWDVARWLPSLNACRYTVHRVVSDRALLSMHGPQLAFGQVASGPLASQAERIVSAAFAILAPR